MKKILMIFTVGIVAMSALSCTSKLENEIAELKKQINVKPEPEPKFELVIENPNILPCATLEGEQTHKFKVPYTLKNATGKTTVTAICKSYFGDNIRVGTVPADEKSGFVNIEVKPYKDYFDEGDGYYYSYSGASIYVTALDESGKTSVQIIRIPQEGFTIGLVDSYDGNPSITVPATEDKASFLFTGELPVLKNIFLLWVVLRLIILSKDLIMLLPQITILYFLYLLKLIKGPGPISVIPANQVRTTETIKL